jgi:hypothetical protein
VSLVHIREDIRSADIHVLRRGIDALLRLAQKDPGVREEAGAVFRKFAAGATDPIIAIDSAKGIRLIEGEDAFRKVWLKLLHDSRESIVMNALHASTGAEWLPVMTEMLERRPEASIRQSLLCSLGALKDPSALPTLVRYLADKDLKGYAVIGLANLGDPQAIPHLQPYLSDKTPLWPVDNHGPTELMCDFVASTIQRLQPKEAAKAASPGGAIAAAPPQPRAPEVDAGRSPFWLAYAPLASVALSAAIFAVLAIQVLERRGRSVATAAAQRLGDLAITFPGVLGVICGVVALSRFGRLRGKERVAVIIGTALAGLIAKSFVATLTR